MSDITKQYTPQVIMDSPFPSDPSMMQYGSFNNGVFQYNVQSPGGNTLSPSVIPDAPFPTSAPVTGEIATGTLVSGAMNVGGALVKIDGTKGRILISDGTNNRGLFGNSKA